MSKLLVENKDIAVPGEVLAEGMDNLPKNGDTIIGKVEDITFSGWRIETNSAYSAMLSMKDATSDYIARGADLTQYYNLGDYVVCKIVNVTSQKLVDVSMKGPGLRGLKGGRVFSVWAGAVGRLAPP